MDLQIVSRLLRYLSYFSLKLVSVYRLTRIPAYLETAKRLATWFVTHLPYDGIVPW